jgi:hypothetical protein
VTLPRFDHEDDEPEDDFAQLAHRYALLSWSVGESLGVIVLNQQEHLDAH